MKHLKCFHCGQNCLTEILFKNKNFCCKGCKIVYEIIHLNGLKKFYELNLNPGIIPDKIKKNQFDFLDIQEIKEKLLSFEDKNISLTRLYIPSIHCSSCIWLLENLSKIYPYIIHSTVNFNEKTLQITFKTNKCKLSTLVKILTKLGYKPIITLESIEKKENIGIYNRDILYKLVVSFFCFGNIMLLAFPEYIGAKGDNWLLKNNFFFRWLMLILSLPVVLFSAIDYFKSAYNGLKNKLINIDIPISLGILILFFQTFYEVVFNLGSGYSDTLTGLVFFLLTGRYFQIRTYQYLSFNKDYKSFYPIYITHIKKNIEKNILISQLKKNDHILIRNEEIIPADAILIRGIAMIDNSFITGESKLISKNLGDYIYAGGKQKGGAIELKIIKEVNQSYLTELWNHKTFNKKKVSTNKKMINNLSCYFTSIILLLSLITGLYYWILIDFSKSLQIVSSILIVACPCSLALSTSFTLGNIMRILSKKGFFVKDIYTIERSAKIQSLVFDKTGTITISEKTKISFIGESLNKAQLESIAVLLNNSNHPLSKILYKKLNIKEHYLMINNFQEIPGKGLEGIINQVLVKIGSASYVGELENINQSQTKVFIAIGEDILGYFLFHNSYRRGLKNIFQSLNKYKISILSGDNNSEKKFLKKILPINSRMFFNKNPKNKLKLIKKLQNYGEKVMMFGDGINDAGSLKQSEVGIAVFDNNNRFSPNCDILMDAKYFNYIPQFLKLTKTGVFLVKINFFISLIYNIIGLTFAISGTLKPVIAAILMPLSSISVVTFSIISTWISAYKSKMI